MARCPVGTSPQAPRLEPDLRLSPRPARHLQISLGLSSVAWCAYRLEVAHAISLRWVLELPAWYDVIHFYLAGMEWFSFAFANIWQIECTDRTFEENCFVS